MMMRPPVLPLSAARVQRGLTLVELLIGMALGLMIVLALFTLLINVSRNNAELARTNSVIENGRFAQQVLETDLVHAGFWGGFVPTFDDLSVSAAIGSASNATTVAFPAALPDPCAAYPADWTTGYKAQLVAIPVQVYAVPASGTSPVCAAVIATAQPSSDVLVVRHAAPCAATAGATEQECQDVAGNMYFQTSRCANDAASWVLSATAADLSLRNGKCDAAPLVAKYRFVSTLYWVRRFFVTDGDGIPTLVRTRFQLVGGNLAHQGTETLIDGIQAMRVQLGVDNVSKPAAAGGTGTTLTAAMFQNEVTWGSTANQYTPTNRGDGNADAYVTCNDAAAPCSVPFNLANTVAVRVSFLARASSPTPGYTDEKSYSLAGSTVAAANDRFKRHVYTQTVRLNNISMRREVPPP
jgi:type IV pilus assembly protein PilW